jgi:hypothetical protein
MFAVIPALRAMSLMIRLTVVRLIGKGTLGSCQCLVWSRVGFRTTSLFGGRAAISDHRPLSSSCQ